MPHDVTAEKFLQHVHDALTHFHELQFQQTHPLCDALRTSPPLTPATLHRLLVGAFDLLKPPAHVDPSAVRWRHYRYLQLRYVDGVPVDRLGLVLGVGDRQARREHHAALQELATTLMQITTQPHPLETVNQLHRADLAPESGMTFEGEVAGQGSGGAAFEAELSSLGSGPGPEPLELVAAIDDAIRLVGRLATRRGVEIVRAPVRGQPRVVVTRTVLRQILLIILNYFLDLETIQRFTLSLSDDAGASQVHLTLTDERPGGVAAAALSLDPPVLLAARRLAESQDGTLRIERRANGGIALDLSLVTDSATLVVVIDDNPDLIRLFRRYLRGHGFRLLQVRAGQVAVEFVRAAQPDVVTLDLMMPVQDGWDLLDELRRDPATVKIPIIACSILPERDLALSLGATDFLAKPVNPGKLLATLTPFRRRPSRVPASLV